MKAYERLLKYVTFPTASDESASACPSTEKQFALANYLAEEMKAMGLTEVTVDKNCYVYATLEANTKKDVPVIGFIAHLDTSPDAPDAENITKIVVEHTDYPGDTRKYVDTLSIDMAQGLLVASLRYAPIRTPADGTPIVKLTYFLDDGSEVAVEANDKTVWWNGKSYAIRKEGEFVKYCARHFFEDPLDPYQEYREQYSTKD